MPACLVPRCVNVWFRLAPRQVQVAPGRWLAVVAVLPGTLLSVSGGLLLQFGNVSGVRFALLAVLRGSSLGGGACLLIGDVRGSGLGPWWLLVMFAVLRTVLLPSWIPPAFFLLLRFLLSILTTCFWRRPC